ALPPEEAAHLARVLRLRPGDAIRVFNGRGGEFDARVDEVSRQHVQVTIGAAAPAAVEPTIGVVLAQAVLRTDRMDAAVRDAVMLGVAGIQPVVSTRSETTLAALDRADRTSRWARIAVSSAKQCGRATLPPIHVPCTFE